MFNSSINNNDNPNNNDHDHDLNANKLMVDKSFFQSVTVDGWRSEGCFKVLKKGEKIDFNERFADFKAIGEMKCDVKTAFELCKVAAEEKGYEMFGVLVSTFLC